MKYIILALIFSCGCDLSFAQQNDWASQQAEIHNKFHQNFRTTDYVCEVKSYAEIIFDLKSNNWNVRSNNSYYLGKKELVRIIKSDDINKPIPHCGVNDEPRSFNAKADKYFCLVMTHPKANGFSRFLSNPDQVDSTNYKCILNIEVQYGKEDVNTLKCTAGFKFSLTHSKYFDNDLSGGPYFSSLGFDPKTGGEEKLTQKLIGADCTSINK